MAINYIWIFLLIAGFLTATFKFFTGVDVDIYSALVQSIFDMGKTSVDISIYLVGVMTFWLGIMKVGEKGGALELISKLMSPFLRPLFPEIPKNHKAMGSMIMNISANMLGLDNAATPLGLKAMGELQELNPSKEKASNAQIMFLVLNASGLTIIPISILALRASMGSANPADVFFPILLATTCSTIGGMILTALIQKINLFQKGFLVLFGIIISLLLFFLMITNNGYMPQVNAWMPRFGNLAVLLFILFFLGLSVIKKQNTYNDFIDGAKEGFQNSISIIPYLLAMLVAIGIFRSSGALDYILIIAKKIFTLVGLKEEICNALPTALMKPLSGSGARAMMVETMKTYGADSFSGRLASIFQGSTETTLYVLSVYFGYVGIKNSRHALVCGLFADLAGVIAAIAVCLYFF